MSVVVVPMDVRALVVGKPDSARDDAFARMAYDFETLAEIDADSTLAYLGESIAPQPGSVLPATHVPPGIHLHWAVPAALSHTEVSEGTGRVQFVPAPNRWLVVRIGATAAHETVLEGWVVASDLLWDDDPGTLDAHSRPAPIVPSYDDPTKLTRRLGRVTPLGQQPAGTDAADHTVVGHGITTFGAVSQHAPNVFGMCDALADAAGLSSLSYLVAGWHSDPKADPVQRLTVPADGTVASALAAATGWQFAPVDGAGVPTRSICAGVVTGVPSDLTRGYVGAQTAGADLAVAVGATAPEALAALLADRDGGSDKAQLELALTLLQEGLLPQLTAPGGHALCDEGLHARRFVAVPGGLQWQLSRTIAKDGGDPGADLAAAARAASAPLPEALAGALGELNRLQAEADALARTVSSGRSQLFADWCKYVELPNEHDLELNQTDVFEFLQATVEDLEAAAGRLTKKKATVKHRHRKLKTDASKAGYTLDRVPAARFWQPADPVVVLMGDDVVRPDRQGRNGAKGFPFPLTTRLAQALTGSLSLAGGEQVSAAGVTALDLGATPFAAELGALVTEAVLLDDGQAGALAQSAASPAGEIATAQAAARRAVPALGFATWKQPWIPLMLDWQVSFTPDPDTTAQPYATDLLTEKYDLEDELVCTDPATVAQHSRLYSGSALLSTGVTLPLRGQIDDFVAAYPDDPMKADLLDLEQKLRPATPENPDGQPLLAQALSGLGAALLMRRQTLQLPVHDPYAEGSEMQDFVGRVEANVNPGPNQAHNDLAAIPSSAYAPLRGGTASLTAELRLVDAFGQYRTIPAATCIRAASLIPPWTADEAELWLPPRLQQGARLNLRWLSARDDTTESVDAASSPVCGWLLFNHVDDSLAVYDADGTPLGALSVEGSIWRNAPTDPPALADKIDERLRGANPHLTAFATSIALPQPRTGFLRDLLATIDSTLTNVATGTAIGSGSTATLVGRPLALVRASVDLELLGAPALDQSWTAFSDASDAYQADPPDSGTGGVARDTGGVPDVEVTVALGDPDGPHDGLIGFFAGDVYKTFLAPVATDGGNGVRPAGRDDLTVSAGGKPVMLTLIVDPRQAINATTGLLPRKTVTLPPSMYADALRALNVTFAVTPAVTVAGAATVPVPPEPGFDWSWLTLAGDGHDSATLDTAALGVAAPGLGGPPAQAADGWLALGPAKPSPPTGGP